jgi:hypothetical protein
MSRQAWKVEVLSAPALGQGNSSGGGPSKVSCCVELLIADVEVDTLQVG